MSAPTNRSVLEGHTFSLSFSYLAIPTPNFTWYINDRLLTEVRSTSNGKQHTITFTNANEEGWYRCVVQNKYGPAEYRVFVDVLSKNSLVDAAVGMCICSLFAQDHHRLLL